MTLFSSSNTTVYTTDHGKMCSRCNQAIDLCICKKNSTPKTEGIIKIMRETQGRKGKVVTKIIGICLDDLELQEFAKTCKKRYATGGSIHDGIIELQGDQREKLKQDLEKKGWKFRIC
ncbi:MAG: stress response translation initiation inhibitor YciH [Candidatus Brocadiae bacterium]|nr:stress response translation initiation inhibitor YciH [Candidatus Brocadiia bacterium]